MNNFWKKRHGEKQIFDINELFIQSNKDSLYDHVPLGVNIDLYGCFSLLAPDCAVCLCVWVCVCVCVRSNQSTSKKLHYLSDLSKLIVSILPHLFCWGEGGGWASYQIFKKGEGFYRNSNFQFLEGVCWEKAGLLFSGCRLEFLQKK